MFRGPFHGGIAGFCIGLTEDLFFGRFIGLNALAKCAASVCCGNLTKSIFRENMSVPVINVLVASLVSMVLVYVLGSLAGARWYLSGIAYQSVFEILFNVCLVPYLYGFYYQFANKYHSPQQDAD
jgi:rod shape-determining protein MreD